MIDKQAVEAYLASVSLPDMNEDIMTAKVLRNLSCEAGRVSLGIELGYPCRSTLDALAGELRQGIQALPGVESVAVDAGFRIKPHAVQPKAQRIKAVRNIIAVASAKGGVGKSTVAANLALALAAEGAKTGMLDADIYGPSQPLMLGARQKPEAIDEQYIEPVMAHGLQTMSIGYLLDDESPAVWRGPMVTQALTQLLFQTRWDDLDYLVIDMPPGTGDIQLTLAQKIPVAGAIIVTTPQDLALLDARRGLRMFEKVKVPVLGIVENMSTHICPECGHEQALFGSGGGARLARDTHVELLAQLPLDIRIREQADGGNPTVAAEPEGELAARYLAMARKAAARLAVRARDYSGSFPKIVVEDS